MGEGNTREAVELPRDLLCGIGPRHVRVLCDNTWEGGYGYTPSQVGNMTIDQVFMLFAKREHLRASYRTREIKCDTVAVAAINKTTAGGMIKGRDRHGNALQATIKGKSKARRLMEQAIARKAAEKPVTKRRRKRR